MKTILNSVTILLKRLYRKMWWLDVVYPFLLCASLFTGLTLLIYKGQKHRRLSSQIEESLIQFSLRLASPRPIVRTDRIKTISLHTSDLNLIPNREISRFTDADDSIYLEIIKKLVDWNVSYLIVYWRPANHKDFTFYRRLNKLISKTNIKIVFAVPPRHIKSTPTLLHESTEVVEADPCQNGIQTICIYEEQWSDWIIQLLASDFWYPQSTGDKKKQLSLNLPRIYPSYLLHLNEADDFDDVSFSGFLQENDSSKYRNRIVLVGNNLVQGRPGMSKPEDIGRVLTVNSPKDIKTREEGTPLHKFWAQLIQMFIDNKFIKIIPFKFSMFFSLSFSLLITLMLFFYGLPIAMGVFMCIATLAPLLNALGIYYYQTYMPLFDFIYGGLTTFISITFVRLSLESFRNWRLSFQQKTADEIADSKGNFISLISHNLNTPIAKMQGLLDVLFAVSKDIPKEKLAESNWLISYIKICIKDVLAVTAVEEGRLNNEPMNLDTIQNEFQTSFLSTIKKLGVNLKVTKEQSELSLIPLRFDKRALSTCLVSIASLYANNGRNTDVSMHLTICEEEIPNKGFREFLRCEFSSNNIDDLSEATVSSLTNCKTTHSRKIKHSTLLHDLAINLVIIVTHAYKGNLNIDKNKLTLHLYQKA